MGQLEDFFDRNTRYDGIVFAFDTTVFATKQAIVEKWIPIAKHQISKQKGSSFDEMAKFALGLKLDLPSKIVSSFDREFESAVGGNGFDAGVQCSSLTGVNVIPAMEEIVTALLKRREAQEEAAAQEERTRELQEEAASDEESNCSTGSAIQVDEVPTVSTTATRVAPSGTRRHRGRTKTTKWYKKGRAKLSSSDDDE